MHGIAVSLRAPSPPPPRLFRPSSLVNEAACLTASQLSRDFPGIIPLEQCIAVNAENSLYAPSIKTVQAIVLWLVQLAGVTGSQLSRGVCLVLYTVWPNLKNEMAA